MNFETVIGLEVHVELNTNSKIFSPTSAHFGNEQNTNTNVIDWSFPGVLPVLNKGVVDAGIKAALALNMDIHQHMHFDRKNYFYPDNPKAYQISQFDEPIGYNGWIEVQLEDGTTKKIGIERAHLEEDAGKNTHGTDGFSYIDLNRQGVPLIEIVSEADMRSPEEAYAYLTALKEVIQYTGISDVKMEEGSMRVDANISLRPYGQEEFGTKTELKNLNSFSNVRKGLEYEVQRQAKILRSGGVIRQETRRYDEDSKETVVMRAKGDAVDYKYYPEPNILPIRLNHQWVEGIIERIPEMPESRVARYINEYKIPKTDALILVQTKEVSDFFDATVAYTKHYKIASNWLLGEVQAYLNKNNLIITDTNITPEYLAKMINYIQDGTISSKQGKKVFEILMNEGKDPEIIIEENNMKQISSPEELTKIINEVLDNNPQSIEDYSNGKDRAVGFLVGQIMKKTGGQANPGLTSKLLIELLKQRIS